MLMLQSYVDAIPGANIYLDARDDVMLATFLFQRARKLLKFSPTCDLFASVAHHQTTQSGRRRCIFFSLETLKQALCQPTLDAHCTGFGGSGLAWSTVIISVA